jgi:hypothetical protein
MKRKVSEAGPERLANQLDVLGGLDGKSLKQRWGSLYNAEPPARLGPSVLVQALAYRQQENALGGLKPSTRRLLERASADAAAGRRTRSTDERRIKPGTVLLREWHAVTHQVTVLKDHVLFRGQRYRSLSEVARRITGSRWSGPLFFGLRSNGKERDHGKR